MSSARGVMLRPLQPADLPEAVDLWVAAWHAAYPAIDFEARRAWFVDRIAEQQSEGAEAIVALMGGRVVGLLLINPQTAYLDQIVVASDRQGAGMAELLMNRAKECTPSGFALHVNQDNARAIRFYEKQGLRITGESTNPRSGAPIYELRWSGPAAAPADSN